MSEEVKPQLVAVANSESDSNPEPAIAMPGEFNLDRFKSKTPDSIANVATLLTALPQHRIADARDFVRLHPDDQKYWSPELCFVNVPIKGMKNDTLHLIDEDLATRFLDSKKILRFRLTLATKPFDIFFLCQVPTRNLDNPWNATNLNACVQAKGKWVQATSRKAEGAEGYHVQFAREDDAFPTPQWPNQSLNELIGVTFTGRMIENDKDPALARLIGAKPATS